MVCASHSTSPSLSLSPATVIDAPNASLGTFAINFDTSTMHQGGTMPTSLPSSSPPMSVELPTSTSGNTSSSSSSNGEKCACECRQRRRSLQLQPHGSAALRDDRPRDRHQHLGLISDDKEVHDHYLPCAAADRRTYQPSFLSIGPYHCGDNNATAEMLHNEQGKLWAAGFVLRSGAGGPAVLAYTEAVAAMEADARSCYEGDVGMPQDAFCRMLLLDSCQLIILLLLYFGGAAAADDDAAAGGGGSSHGSAAESAGPAERSVKTRDICMTVHDLMMLENQIPFFVVDKIYQLGYGGGGGGDTVAPPVRSLAWEAMQVIMGGVPAAPGGHDDKQELQHLVHLCHLYLKPTCLVNQPQNACGSSRQRRVKYGRFRRATEYYDAGVKFRLWSAEEESAAGGGGSRSRRPMLDVRSSARGGVLSMALQSIDGTTGYILANVLAFEQKYYLTATSACSSYVTAYVVFMSQLLGGAEDVALLASRGVMEHQLGTDAEVCALFRGLADGLFFDPDGEHYLSPVGAALKVHCSHRRNRWRAWIVRHRFGNPWLGAAWVFGASAVLCTIIQTVFAVLSYVQQG
ncbi:hypothetical protein U9M48_011592 [Paspalum notatum var. saurae]|uniref:Uncharacterized protein n=1 Tax=Paspalum notatum var. saurae TaxID=547442 RepID=A0AAQ3SXD3_PASNO